MNKNITTRWLKTTGQLATVSAKNIKYFATRLGCIGIIDNDFIANLLLSLTEYEL